ncbi:MAG TPA: hypothetical protein VMF13_02105 [Luteitalea sp.]|nr:hypothetical protein [Luteitalea sp.]
MPDTPSLKPVAEKLGARPGQRWHVKGGDLGWLRTEIEGRGATVVARLPASAHCLVYRVAVLADLDALTKLRPVIAPAGAIWVIWEKGRPALKEDHVRAAALGQGLVDVKVIRVSDTLSGLKLVIPVALRS